MELEFYGSVVLLSLLSLSVSSYANEVNRPNDDFCVVNRVEGLDLIMRKVDNFSARIEHTGPVKGLLSFSPEKKSISFYSDEQPRLSFYIDKGVILYKINHNTESSYMDVLVRFDYANSSSFSGRFFCNQNP